MLELRSIARGQHQTAASVTLVGLLFQHLRRGLPRTFLVCRKSLLDGLSNQQKWHILNVNTSAVNSSPD